MCLMEYSVKEKMVLKSMKVTQFCFKQIIVVERSGNQTYRLSLGKTILKQLLILEIRMMMNSTMNLILHIQRAVQLERSNRLFLIFLQLIRAPALSSVNFLTTVTWFKLQNRRTLLLQNHQELKTLSKRLILKIVFCSLTVGVLKIATVCSRKLPKRICCGL